MTISLLTVAWLAAKAKAAVPPPPPTALELVRDVLLFQGSFGFMYWLCLVGYCMAVFRVVLQAKPQIRFLHGLVLGVITALGGSTMAAVMCGKPVPFVTNESLIPALFCVWGCMYTLPTAFLTFMKETSVGSVSISLSYEIFRCHVMMNCVKMAQGALSPGAYSVSVVGPLVAGAVGACGGGFLPFDKGLGPLEKETNWRISSAILGSAWMYLAGSDPTAKGVLVACVPALADFAWVRFVAVGFFALAPMAQAFWPGFNPLGSNPLVGAPTPAPAPSAAAAAGGGAAAGFDVTSWLLFLAVLVNQMGRVMVPAIKTSVLADDDFAPDFEQGVGAMLSGVSLVCLGGKFLGAAVTDKLGGWVILIGVFAMWILATLGAVSTQSVSTFGALWLLNSFAYTITWGSAVQVVGQSYGDKERGAQLSKVASASRFGATFGNILFGQLLSAGLHWRRALLPIVPVQVLLLLMCGYYWFTSRGAPPPPAADAKKAKAAAAAAPASGGPSALQAMLSLDFWLMLVPKAVLFTYTQFFMNYIPQLLHADYGFDHGDAATFGGIATGGSVVGLLFVGNVLYKSLDPKGKVALVFVELAVCVVVPAVLASGPLLAARLGLDLAPLAVPLLVLWGVAYALPFYIPPGEFAMAVGGKTSTALYTNLFDAAGFTVSAAWNPWASALAKRGDFATVLYSQALFGAISLVCMPLCMARVNAKADAEKKNQ